MAHDLLTVTEKGLEVIGLFFDSELHEMCVYFGDESFVICFICRYFLNSEDCLFILFRSSFAVEKLLSLIRSHLFIFAFILITLGGGSKKILLQYMSIFCLFSSKRFIVSSLTFRCLIHFEFIFVYGIRECSNFILLHVAFHFFSSNTY